MGQRERIGFFGEAGATLRDGLFGPLQRGRYGAFNDFLVDTQCFLFGVLESGSREAGAAPLANGWAFLRGFNGCYSGAQPPYTANVFPPPFTGGQCPGTLYEVDVAWQTNFEAPRVQPVQVYGPVEGVFLKNPGTLAGTGELVLIARDISGNELEVGFGFTAAPNYYEYYRVDDVSVVGGGPDDCGDPPAPPPEYPPPVEALPAPSDGQELFPKQYRDTTVDVNGTPVPITIEIGPSTYHTGQGIKIPIDGIPHWIDPDGGIAIDPQGDPDEEAADTIQEALDEIEEKLDEDISGLLEWEKCDGEILEEPFEGSGFSGLKAMIMAMNDISQGGSSEYCPVIAPLPLQGSELSSDVVGPSEIPVFEDVNLPVEAIVVTVDVSGGANMYASGGSSTPPGDKEQARFGVVSLGYQVGSSLKIESVFNQYYRRGVYSIPQSPSGPRTVRLSLMPGMVANVRSFK